MGFFEYTPLKDGEIRVLTIHPSGSRGIDAPLQADLEHIVLDSEGQDYAALSYAWGDASVLHPLACGKGTLNITTNLRQALLRLRSSTPTKVRIWADAVCINQNDQDEKLKQIAIMRHIYGKAKQTIVWLGDAADDSDTAIRFFDSLDLRLRQKIADHLNARLPFDEASRIMGAYMKSFGRDQATLFQDFDPDRTMRAIVAFMARPWFRRAWCIQVYVVSPDLKMLCGDRECSSAFAMPTFIYAFDGANIRLNKYVPASQREDVFRGIEQMTQIQDQHNDYEKGDVQGHHLFRLLQLYRTSQCTMPVDKVYSLVGISDGWSENVVRSSRGLPSQQPSVFEMPTTNKRDLFVYVAQRVLQSGDGESLFGEATRSRRLSEPNWPSWVPDWTESPLTSQYGHFFSETQWFFKAGGPKAPNRPRPDFRAVRDPENPDAGEAILQVTGAVVQEVFVLGKHTPTRVPGAPNLSSLVDILHSLQGFERLWDETLNAEPYCTGEPWSKIQEVIMRAGQTKEPSEFGASAYREYGWGNANELEFDLAEENTSNPVYANDSAIISSVKTIADELPSWSRSVGNAVAGRVAAVTSSTTTAYVGLVPAGTEKGDQICILRTCSVPYVLRPLENGRYRLVGDCYIHGVMEGELLDSLEFETIQIE
ncbi:hypothetical protein M409DRAFT_18347 [Zasmidium cellare ATCC 36951]|uniref:Heterokaryon incompatibility domain-containing protein n=1 Tax=Zasmidium cellare ATCC 36951 TaxID=1080233 RepID=A0A6A6CVT5_ZASCE|nr:uncharacterized protein M409DRAFT_18347 [Zasmidium cellare ATCC 36951]KAF2171231.1 hypothetical protein M409DRAFT_18347 [Zasmidium cellare ATCC 36951]